MEKKKTIWQLEAVFWLVTAVLTIAVMLPILSNAPDFPFMMYNIIAVAMFFTLARYIFLLRLTPIARLTPAKIILTFLAIGIFFYLLDGLSAFQNTLDEEGTYSMVSHLNVDKQIPLSKYIRSEMIFFGTGAIIATFLLPFRMVISVWRTRNRNTV